jgi:ribosomal protein L40E
MINPRIQTATNIHVICNKCRHEASIILPAKRKRDTDKLVCSKCGAKGWDLVIQYPDIPSNR